MKRILLAAVASAALLGTPALAQTSDNSATTMADLKNLTASDFVAMAASSDMFEIESSQSAETKASSADVKEFAEHMIADHSKSSEKLMDAAKDAGVTPPTAMLAKHAAKLTEVTTLEGDKFDAAYVDAQVTAHEEAVALFTAYSENGDNAELKAFAAETLPVLKEHLEDVQALDAKVSS